jgi:hypothetical protein
VPWEHKTDGNTVIWITPEGDIQNGVSDWETFTSREIVANPSACASGDRSIADMREMFGAKVVG